MERRLYQYDFVAIVMDGKTFGDDEITMAVGVTIQGEKVVMGIIQSGTGIIKSAGTSCSG
jgi:hypothetical protein